MDDETVDDLDEIFDEYDAIINEDEPEGRAGTSADGPNTADNADSSQLAPVIQRRIIRNPRLKFNADRLCGERGIPTLSDHFKNIKFKGKGHQAEDLDKLLATLEHWTHRLFPSMKFADTLRHIEKLGKKKPVQTCLRKIRLDMPILNDDFARDDEDDNVKRNADSDNDLPNNTDFDQLVEEHRQSQSTMENPDFSTPETAAFISEPVRENSIELPSTSTSYILTDEQRKRIERNKMLAAERRKSKGASTSNFVSEQEKLCKSLFEPSVSNMHKASSFTVNEQLNEMSFSNESNSLLISNIAVSTQSEMLNEECTTNFDRTRAKRLKTCEESSTLHSSFSKSILPDGLTEKQSSIMDINDASAFASVENIIGQPTSDKNGIEFNNPIINPIEQKTELNSTTGDKENINSEELPMEICEDVQS